MLYQCFHWYPPPLPESDTSASPYLACMISCVLGVGFHPFRALAHLGPIWSLLANVIRASRLAHLEKPGWLLFLGPGSFGKDLGLFASTFWALAHLGPIWACLLRASYALATRICSWLIWRNLAGTLGPSCSLLFPNRFPNVSLAFP